MYFCLHISLEKNHFKAAGLSYSYCYLLAVFMLKSTLFNDWYKWVWPCLLVAVPFAIAEHKCLLMLSPKHFHPVKASKSGVRQLFRHYAPAISCLLVLSDTILHLPSVYPAGNGSWSRNSYADFQCLIWIYPETHLRKLVMRKRCISRPSTFSARKVSPWHWYKE